MASARRISQITDQQPEVTFVEDEASPPAQVALTLREVTFRYPQQPSPALGEYFLQIAAGEHIAILGRTGCGKSTLLQLLTRAPGPVTGRDSAQQSAALRPQRSHSAAGNERSAAARAPVQRHPARQPAAGGAWKRMTLISALPLRRWASKTAARWWS